MTSDPKNSLWPPLTLSRVVAWAALPLGHLLRVELLVALVSAGSIVWFFMAACRPIIQEAIEQLPEHGVIRRGQLEWGGTPSITLGRNPLIAIGVDLAGNAQGSPPADLRLVFGETSLKIGSRFGQFAVGYPSAWNLPFNRAEVGPLWNTWGSILPVAIGAGTVIGLLLGWASLALIYSGLIRMVSVPLFSAVGWAGCWRLASAALMPGALWMSAAIALYGMRFLDWRGYLFAFIMHFAIGWVYLVCALRLTPQAAGKAIA